MTIFQRNITMSLICKDDETLRRTSVRKLKPLAFNLNLIQQLSELSWLPVDNNVSITEMEQAFRSIVRTKRFSAGRTCFWSAWATPPSAACSTETCGPC